MKVEAGVTTIVIYLVASHENFQALTWPKLDATDGVTLIREETVIHCVISFLVANMTT